MEVRYVDRPLLDQRGDTCRVTLIHEGKAITAVDKHRPLVSRTVTELSDAVKKAEQEVPL